MVEEAECDPFSHFFSGIVDGSEFGIDDPGDDIVVKAYDSDIFRYTAACLFQRLLEHGGTKIIGNKDTVGSGGHVQYFLCGAEGGGLAEVVDEHEAWVEDQAVIF